MISSLSRRFIASSLGLLMLVGGAEKALSFSLIGYRWPDGSQIEMHLQLSHAPVAFQDGSSSWNASAADALSIWNQYVDTVSFVEASAAGPTGGDGYNSVLFSTNIYGETFPYGVLAVTLNYSDSGSGVFTETDVIFNSGIKWNSYRGPIQGSGPTGTYDFHRVALHEFGHVLGLDHPDEQGQNVVAQMNSITSDLDHLADDDIAGGRFLYGLKITSNLFPPSVNVGNNFGYQITANNNPSSFEASPLPPGLQLNPTSGLISGTPTFGGTFDVPVIAHGPGRDASGLLRIVVIGPKITSGLTASIDAGLTFRYQITASQSASSYDASGLPPGLSIDRDTGLITGIPAVGTFAVSVTAHTSSGDAVAYVLLVVLAPRITSDTLPPTVNIGGNFSYQITATAQPTSFSAYGLPDGLRIDPTTGIISGTPTLSGSYQITVIAHTAYGDSVATTVQIRVAKAAPFTDPPIATFPSAFINSLAADPQRPRMYVATFKKITVIDTQSLSVLKVIDLPYNPWDMDVSVDGSKLWVATKSFTLGLIDLETLTALDDLVIPEPADQVREGLNQRLYISSNQSGAAQIDLANGGVEKFNPDVHGFSSHCAIEISHDRKTLYVGDLVDVDPVLARYDISAEHAALVQSVFVNQAGAYASLSLSHDGQIIFFGAGKTVPLRSTANLSVVSGTLDLGEEFGGPLGFAADDLFTFVSIRTNFDQSKIAVFDTKSSRRVRTITLPESSNNVHPVVDSTNSYVFVYSGPGFVSSPELKVYPVYTAASLPPPPRSLLNVSTRLRTQGGDNVLIGGFILKGSEAKQVALRAMGPSLPVTGKLADPLLELHDATGAVVAQNDNWNAHRNDVLLSGIPPSDEHEAVILATLQPGSYTAVVRGVAGSSGVALVEIYDLSSNSNSKLANISTRGKVETADNVMIGGFIIGGDQATNVVVRAIGPSLANVGVAGSLSDPMLEAHDGNGALLAQDDDWRQYQEQALINSGLAPADDRESAMLLSLQPGAYTAIVRGKNDSTGVGLVEVYNLDAN